MSALLHVVSRWGGEWPNITFAFVTFVLLSIFPRVLKNGCLYKTKRVHMIATSLREYGITIDIEKLTQKEYFLVPKLI